MYVCVMCYRSTLDSDIQIKNGDKSQFNKIALGVLAQHMEFKP